MSRPAICINVTEFNVDRVVMSEVKELKTKANIKMKIAEISYLNDEQEACDFYISLPKIETFGP